MHISQLFIYPIKSCAPVELEEVSFDSLGPVWDRRFMVIDENGKFLTQRSNTDMAFIQPKLLFDSQGQLEQMQLSVPDKNNLLINPAALTGETVSVTVWKDNVSAQDCGDDAAVWLSDYLDQSCRLVMITTETQRQVNLKRAEAGRYVGFADGYPLLVVTQASLDFLSDKAGRSIDVERFRPNIVIAGAIAFEELQWKEIQHEQGYIDLVKPCERCVIPTRELTSQKPEKDVVEVLKNHFRIERKIIFGQNGIDYGIQKLVVGDKIKVSE